MRPDPDVNHAELLALRAQLRPGQTLFGLDLGEKTIGIALSDTTLTIASPLETLKRTKFGADAARLSALAAQHDAGGLVIGLPLNMDGSAGPAAQAARAFARNISRTGLQTALWDERLSTIAVTRTLLAADASRRRRAQVVDKMAAAYILQGALDWLKRQAATGGAQP